MTTTTLSRGRSRRLGFLLFVVTVPPAATLLSLGLTILDQDRTIAAEQAGNRREAMVRGSRCRGSQRTNVSTDLRHMPSAVS